MNLTFKLLPTLDELCHQSGHFWMCRLVIVGRLIKEKNQLSDRSVSLKMLHPNICAVTPQFCSIFMDQLTVRCVTSAILQLHHRGAHSLAKC